MSPAQELRALLDKSGLKMATYSPNDGMTRYRFFPFDSESDGYFASSTELFTALGRKEAITFLRGYLRGWCERGRT